MATIALLSPGMRGHLAPLARLAAVLGRQGHRLHAWVPAEYRGAFPPGAAEFVAHEPVPPSRFPLALTEFAAELAEGTRRCAAELIEGIDARGVNLVVHDVHAPWARVAAEFLGLPRIVTTPLFPIDYEALWPSTGRRDLDSRLHAAAAEIERRWGVELGDWGRVVWSPGEVTVNFSTEEVSGIPEQAPGWTHVGPLLGCPPPRAPSGQRPRVYVSFGTFVGLRRELLATAVQAMAGEPVEVLLSTGRIGLSPSALEPHPRNVCVREFVDARAELARADVFVTHGGCGSVHESLAAGVPMVCVPQGADQFDWSRRVRELGAGVQAEAQAGPIRQAVQALLADRRYADEARRLGDRLMRFDGAERLAAIVDGCLAPAESGR